MKIVDRERFVVSDLTCLVTPAPSVRPQGFDDASLQISYEKCEHAALAILSNHETLSLRHDFKQYTWYIHGLGSFHAFLAISTLSVLLRKGLSSSARKCLILQAMQRSFQRVQQDARHSDICKSAASRLEQSIIGKLPQRNLFEASSNGVDLSPKSMPLATSDPSDSFDPSLSSLPESFEDTVSGIPCEQWISPATFPWTDSGRSDMAYNYNVL